MGFGIMFIGSVFLLHARAFGIDVVVDFVGFIILFKGLSVANKYTDKFAITRRVSFFGIFVSLIHLAYTLVDAFTENIFSNTMSDIVFWVYTIFIFAFYLSLYRSIVGICREVDLPKYGLRAYTGMVFTFILFLGGRFLEKYGGLLTTDSGINNVLGIAGYVIENIFVIYTMVLIFNCYMFICLEGDEDMPDTRKNKRLPSPVDIWERSKEKNAKKHK